MYGFRVVGVILTLLLTVLPGTSAMADPVAGRPATKADCKNGGFSNLVNSEGETFTNQGDCVSAANHGNAFFRSADLVLYKYVSYSTPTDVTYQVWITNYGPDPAQAVHFKDESTAPIYSMFVDYQLESCGATLPALIVECDLGTIAPGEGVQIQVSTTRPANDTSNTASAYSAVPDPDLTNNVMTALPGPIPPTCPPDCAPPPPPPPPPPPFLP